MKMDKATLGISPTRQAGGYMHNSIMLAVLSDCVLRCNDGDVRANTYALVQSCDVISNMFEDMGETDAPGDDRVFVIDRFSSRTMKFVVDLIQKSIEPSDVKSIEDARDILVAMDFLCCTTRWKRMVDRLWTLIRASPACDTKRLLLENAGFIVPEHPAAFFTKYRRMCPGWQEYKALFEAVPMTPETAILFVTQLMTYFPMPMIVHAIVSNTPKRQISNVTTGIFHIQRIGRYFHPDELLVAMDTIHLAASTNVDTAIMDCVVDSHRGVNVQTPVHKIKGTMVTLKTKNMANFAFTVERSLTRLTTVSFSSNSAVFSFDPDTGLIEMRVRMHKLGDTGRAVDTVYVRTTSYPKSEELEMGHMSSRIDWDGVRDTWSTVLNIDHTADGEIVNTERIDAGDVAMVRVDLFWLHDPRQL